MSTEINIKNEQDITAYSTKNISAMLWKKYSKINKYFFKKTK